MWVSLVSPLVTIVSEFLFLLLYIPMKETIFNENYGIIIFILFAEGNSSMDFSTGMSY